MIEERGGKPFFEDQVPRAVIRFKQGVGRLIRSGDDTGRVVVLDPRIVTKGYGRSFQAALPEGVEPEPLDPPEPIFEDYDAFDEWSGDGDGSGGGAFEDPGGFDALD
jgi:Rad3-related DNA helicase